jgi:hypothetical protein
VARARKNHGEVKKNAVPSMRSVSCAVASAAEKRSKASGRAVAAIPISRRRPPGRLRRNGERMVGGRRRDGSEGGVKREGTGVGGIIMGRRSGDAAGVGLALALHEKLSCRRSVPGSPQCTVSDMHEPCNPSRAICTSSGFSKKKIVFFPENKSLAETKMKKLRNRVCVYAWVALRLSKQKPVSDQSNQAGRRARAEQGLVVWPVLDWVPLVL